MRSGGVVEVGTGERSRSRIVGFGFGIVVAPDCISYGPDFGFVVIVE